MTTPSNDDGAPAAEAGVDRGPGVDLGKQPVATPEPPFDPYRFGKPDHPVPPEYAPPGYVPDQPATPPPPGVYPSAPYGQAPYGRPYPPPPPGRPLGSGAGNNGKAVTSLVLGIASIVLCWLSFLALFAIVPALVLGIIALNEAKTRGGNGRSMAIAGIACAVVAAVLATVLTVLVFRAADRCGGVANSNDPGFQQCVQDNFFR